MSERYPPLMDTSHLESYESDHTLNNELSCSPCCIGLHDFPCSCVLDDNSPTHFSPNSLKLPALMPELDCHSPDVSYDEYWRKLKEREEKTAKWIQYLFKQKSYQDMSNNFLTQRSKEIAVIWNVNLFKQQSDQDVSTDASNQSSQQHVGKQSKDLFDHSTSPDFPCGSRSIPGTFKKPDQIQSLGNSSISGVSMDYMCCSTTFQERDSHCSTASQEHDAKSDKDLLKEFKIAPCFFNLSQCNLFTGEHPKKSDEDLRRENGISECFVPVKPLAQFTVNLWTQSQLVPSYRAHFSREYVAQVIRLGYNKYKNEKKVKWRLIYEKYLKVPYCVLNYDWFKKTAEKSINDYLKSQKLLKKSKRSRAKLIELKETEMKQKKRVYYMKDSYVLVDREDSDLYTKAVQNMKLCKVVCHATDI